VNYPRLRPGSLLRAIVHVALSFAGFALLPTVLNVFSRLCHHMQRSPTSC
jgi:hypothetical protein